MARELTKRQRLFLSYYLGSCRFNAFLSAKKAGYRWPECYGPVLLKKLQKSPDFETKLREYGMFPEEIIARLTDVARGSLDDFVDIDDDTGTLLLNMRKAKQRNLLHTFESVEYSDKGRLKLKRYSALEAMSTLARIWQMFGNQEVETDVKTLNILIGALPPSVAGEVRAVISRTLGTPGPQEGLTIDVDS